MAESIAVELLAELDAAVKPLVATCVRVHTHYGRGSKVSVAAWQALHKIDAVRDALRSEIRRNGTRR